MNIKRIALGGTNLVFALLAILVAMLFGLLSALPIAITGLNASGFPVTLVERVGQLAFALSTFGFAAVLIATTAGWFTGRVSLRLLSRFSLVGLGFAVLAVLSAVPFTEELIGLLVAAVIPGFFAIPLAINVVAVRFMHESEPEVESESGFEPELELERAPDEQGRPGV